MNQLLLVLLEALKSGKLELETVVKLIERANFTIFSRCELSAQLAWIEYSVKVLTQGI